MPPKVFATFERPEYEKHGHAVVTVSEVEVMAIASGYAMVRKPGCLPFVVALRDLTFDKVPK